MSKSKHSKFVFLDFTYRPNGGLSSDDLNILHSSFVNLTPNSNCIQGIFAVEVCNDKAGSLIGTRHVHIRLWFRNAVEPYKVFRPNLNLDYAPFRKHMKHTLDSDAKRKFGYCMKDFRYEWLRSCTTETFYNECWSLYQDSEKHLQADVTKLINVSKKNLLPIMLQHHSMHFGSSVTRNWRQLIIHMVNSNRYNFQFLHYKDIIQIMYLGSQCPDDIVLNAFEWSDENRLLTQGFSTSRMCVKRSVPPSFNSSRAAKNVKIELTKVEKIGVTYGLDGGH